MKIFLWNVSLSSFSFKDNQSIELNDAWINRQDLTVGEVLQSNRCLCRLSISFMMLGMVQNLECFFTLWISVGC